MNRFYELSKRKEIPIYTKMKPNKEANHLIKYKKEKDYDYYKCDYCKEEIRILTKKCEMTGGIVIIPYSATKRSNIKMILHNKCLKPVLKIFGGGD